MAPSSAPGATKGSPTAEGTSDAKAEGGFAQPGRLTIALVIFGVIIGQIATWFLLRSQGWVISGDSPHYLIAARTLANFSLHVLPAYRADLQSRSIFNWPHTPGLTALGISHSFNGPHGAIFAQGNGLPALLAPFMFLGSVPLALIAFFACISGGLGYIHQRASRLAGLNRTSQIVFALALAAPAVWLASTQIYPDLISGVFLACVLIEVAFIERNRTVGVQGVVVITAGLVMVPWFQIKNSAAVVLVLVALVLLWRRRSVSMRAAAFMISAALLSIVLLLAYNQYYFGHILGLPQPGPTLGARGLTQMVDLVLDRQQGFLVQVPTILLGLLGLWITRRTLTIVNCAALLGVFSILFINGTYPVDPLGGTALAGRFEWTVVPILLAWTPWFLKELESRRRRLVILGGGIVTLWVLQGVPVLLGDHTLVNSATIPFIPWDPATYPGWWPFVNHYLPDLLHPELHDAVTWIHLDFELVLLAAAAALLFRMMDPSPLRSQPFMIASGAIAVVLVVVGLAGSAEPLPIGPQVFTAADIGSPWLTQATALNTPSVDLMDVGPGTYELTTTGTGLIGKGSSAQLSLLVSAQEHQVVSGWFSLRHPTDASTVTVSAQPTGPGRTYTATFRRTIGDAAGGVQHFRFIVSGASLLSVSALVPAQSQLLVATLSITKLS